MNRQEFYQKSWNYYLILERDFFQIEKYVAFVEDNFETYSNEFAKQLLTICSEIDVQLKEACAINNNREADNIGKYAETLLQVWTDFTLAEVKMMGNLATSFRPWKDWTTGESPEWWKAYNKIKHHRLKDNNIAKASLGNVFNALAALYILETYLYRDIVNLEEPKQDSFLRPQNSNYYFSFSGWQQNVYMANNFVCEYEG